MKFAAAALALFTASASAKLQGNFPADSTMAKSLLKRAEVIEPARHLEQNGQEREMSFMAKYSIKYLGCSSLVQVNREGDAEEGMLYTQQLVKFALCPEDSCNSCSGGGEYVVNMMEFVDAYTEAKLTEKEYACETVRENCYCDNYNDDEACEYQCYVNAGMDDCMEYEGQEEFEIQRYLECAEMEDQNGNNNGNNNYQYYNGNNGNNFYGQYYIGPYCANDGKSINMAVFYDQGCMNKADSSVFAEKNYGMELPFSSEPIVTSECMSCKQVDQDQNQNQNYNYNNNGNQNQNQNQNYNNGNGYYYEEEAEVIEICQQSYESAARCESKMDISYPDTSGCDYIHNILPRLESATRSAVSGGGGGKAAVAFAWIFAATTILFGAYAYFLYRKIKRGAVSLSSQEGALA